MALRTLVAVVSLVLVPASSAGPAYPPFGLDMSASDLTTKPGHDFFQYADGAYVAKLVIPPDQSAAGRRMDMSNRIESHLHELLEEAAKSVSAEPKDLRGKVGAFYASFMDEKTIEAKGVSPIKVELDAILAATDRDALTDLMGQDGLYPKPFAYSISLDYKQPAVYAASISETNLGLPDRDYYVKPDFAAQRTAYRDYTKTLLELVRWTDPQGSAAAVLDLETRLAEACWTSVQLRDPDTQYHPMSPTELAAFAPGFNWKRYLDAANLGGKTRLVITTDTALPKIATILTNTPVSTLKAWMAFRVADTAAPYLSQPFSFAHYQFRDNVLNGQTEQSPRWRRGVAAVSGGDCLVAPSSCFGTLDWGVGQLYTERYFPPETKAKIEALVANLKSAFHGRIEKLDWMGPATKAEALKKLDTYAIKVGYPSKPRDYSHVTIRSDDLVGNVRRAEAAEWEFQLARSDGPVDRDDWSMTPQTNDAYNGDLRDIVFPAGFLQVPIFDSDADTAINYGAIGAVIGHELTHGFDDQGRKIDASGALRDWWTPEDAEAFDARAKVLGDQYAQYEPLPGLHINPDLTMGENIADLGGVSIALDAYHVSLHGKPAQVLDGVTGDQRVFLGWAQAWAGKSTPEYVRKQVTSDPHSPRKFRVNGVVRNIDFWYTAFNVKQGEALFISPSTRARIW
jgi:putative endopeptidase